MTSDHECYVWKWLKGEVNPVVAGILKVDKNEEMRFRYARSYLIRKNKETIYSEELPLLDKTLFARDLELKNFSSIRDAAPDAWGRRVIHSKMGVSLNDELSEMLYLMNSSSDRIGSIDFQQSATQYTPRGEDDATLDVLLSAAELINAGEKLPPDLNNALIHGTGIGGARPKAMIQDAGQKYIAKFSASTDTYDIVKSEFIAMKLAKLCGINVAETKLVYSTGKDVLLVKRFDRSKKNSEWIRHSIVSALTLLQLDERLAHYCTYPELIEKMQSLCSSFKADSRELYSRVILNVLLGNTDDHARNHAFFVNGDKLEITPAYDICPQNRAGGKASHGMNITVESNLSSIDNCLRAAPIFQVSESEAIDIIKNHVRIINHNFESLCDEANLSYAGRQILWRRAFLNDYIFYEQESFKKLVTYELT